MLHIVDADNRHPDGTITDTGVQLLLSASGLRTLPTWSNYPWPCSRCPAPTDCGSAAGLRKHYQTEHAPARTRYACRDCALSFLRYRTFVEHVRSVHEPLLRLSCDVCSTLFWDTERLVAHRAAHGRNGPVLQMSTADDVARYDGTADAADLVEVAIDGGAAHGLDAVHMDFLMSSGDDNEQQWEPVRIQLHRRGGKAQRRKIVQCEAAQAEDVDMVASADGSESTQLAAPGKQQLYECDMCCKT